MIITSTSITTTTFVTTTTLPPETEIAIVPLSQTKEVGFSVTINVSVTNVTDLYAVEFELSFNSGILRCDSITGGDFMGETIGFDPTINNTAGAITDFAKTKTGAGGVNGSGTLAIIQFTTLAEGTSALTLSNIRLKDSSVNDITITVVDGSITVTSLGIGDINGDGLVGLSDLALMGQAWVSSSDDANWNGNADLNSDGVIGLADLAILGQNWQLSAD